MQVTKRLVIVKRFIEANQRPIPAAAYNFSTDSGVEREQKMNQEAKQSVKKLVREKETHMYSQWKVISDDDEWDIAKPVDVKEKVSAASALADRPLRGSTMFYRNDTSGFLGELQKAEHQLYENRKGGSASKVDFPAPKRKTVSDDAVSNPKNLDKLLSDADLSPVLPSKKKEHKQSEPVKVIVDVNDFVETFSVISEPTYHKLPSKTQEPSAEQLEFERLLNRPQLKKDMERSQETIDHVSDLLGATVLSDIADSLGTAESPPFVTETIDVSTAMVFENRLPVQNQAVVSETKSESCSPVPCVFESRVAIPVASQSQRIIETQRIIEAEKKVVVATATSATSANATAAVEATQQTRVTEPIQQSMQLEPACQEATPKSPLLDTETVRPQTLETHAEVRSETHKITHHETRHKTDTVVLTAIEIESRIAEAEMSIVELKRQKNCNNTEAEATTPPKALPDTQPSAASSSTNQTTETNRANKLDQTPKLDRASKASRTSKADQTNDGELTSKVEQPNKIERTSKAEKASKVEQKSEAEQIVAPDASAEQTFVFEERTVVDVEEQPVIEKIFDINHVVDETREDDNPSKQASQPCMPTILERFEEFAPEQYDVLVEYIKDKVYDGKRLIAFCGEQRNVGCSTLTLLAAKGIARHGLKTAVIDANFEFPNLFATLTDQNENADSWVDVLHGKIDWQALSITPEDSPLLTFFPLAKNALADWSNHEPERLQLETNRLITTLHEHFDLILLDCGCFDETFEEITWGELELFQPDGVVLVRNPKTAKPETWEPLCHEMQIGGICSFGVAENFV